MTGWPQSLWLAVQSSVVEATFQNKYATQVPDQISLSHVEHVRCTVPAEEPGGKAKVFDMSPSDHFWRENAGKVFPKVYL